MSLYEYSTETFFSQHPFPGKGLPAPAPPPDLRFSARKKFEKNKGGY